MRTRRWMEARYTNPDSDLTEAPRQAGRAGTVTLIDHDKGWGFLYDDDGVRYFFHRSECVGSFAALHEGQAVTFVIGPGRAKGPRAELVQPLDARCA
jgi:cold shock CspA family protein